MSPTVIGVFMIVVFVLLAGFDLYLSHDAKLDNTFSARFRALGRWWPPTRLVLILAMGLVLGHLFWTPQDVVDVGGAALCPCPRTATDAGPAQDLPSTANTP